MAYDYKSYDAWSMTNGYDQYPVTDPLPSPTDIEFYFYYYLLPINDRHDVIDTTVTPALLDHRSLP